jgi:hypothetical protein
MSPSGSHGARSQEFRKAKYIRIGEIGRRVDLDRFKFQRDAGLSGRERAGDGA